MVDDWREDRYERNHRWGNDGWRYRRGYNYSGYNGGYGQPYGYGDGYGNGYGNGYGGGASMLAPLLQQFVH